jgi:hypothetical protein
MADAARAGMLITLRCDLCRRTVHYWAADLVQVVGPMHRSRVPPWPCGKCKTSEFITLRCEVPSASKIAAGEIVVRRPVKQVLKWIWRDERV